MKKLIPSLSTNPFLKDKINRIIWILIILVILGITGLVYFNFPPTVESINLQHNIYFGISKIGEWWRIFLYPLYGLLIAVVDFILVYFIYRKEKTASYTLSLICLLAQLIIGVQVFIVMLLNVS